MKCKGNVIDDRSGVTRLLNDALVDAVRRVKRARRWYLVDPLTKAFIKAYLMTKLPKIRSMELIRAIVKAVKKLRDIASEVYIPIKDGIREVWKLSILAQSWGHPNAESWRRDRVFILYQAITFKLLSRLFPQRP